MFLRLIASLYNILSQLNLNSLFTHPRKIAAEFVIMLQFFQGSKLFCQFHFSIEPMHTIMALPANKDAAVQLYFIKVFSEKCTPMHFFRNKMMKCQPRITLTQWTISRR